MNLISKIIHLKETNSTNTYAKALLKSGEPLMPYTLIYADRQTAGRGRLGRVWESKEGETLCMSLIAPFPFNCAVPIISSLGVYKALEEICKDADLKIKWPNDIVAKHKKLCGILTESTEDYAVIGIGINLNTEVFPKDIAHKATSVKLVTGKVLDPFEAAVKTAEYVAKALKETKGILTQEIIEEYSSLCINIGREISFREKRGIAVGIAPDGCLIAKTPEGEELIGSGEVTVSGIY